MATDLIHQDRSSPLSLRGWRAAAEVRDARRPVRRAAVRVEAASVVALIGLNRAEMLTAAEVGAVKRQGAIFDARARDIVDAYVGTVVNEILMISARAV